MIFRGTESEAGREGRESRERKGGVRERKGRGRERETREREREGQGKAVVVVSGVCECACVCLYIYGAVPSLTFSAPVPPGRIGADMWSPVSASIV